MWMPEIEDYYFYKMAQNVDAKELQDKYSEFIKHYKELAYLVILVKEWGQGEFLEKLRKENISISLKTNKILGEVLTSNLNTLMAFLAYAFSDILDTASELEASKIEGD